MSSSNSLFVCLSLPAVSVLTGSSDFTCLSACLFGTPISLPLFCPHLNICLTPCQIVYSSVSLCVCFGCLTCWLFPSPACFPAHLSVFFLCQHHCITVCLSIALPTCLSVSLLTVCCRLCWPLHLPTKFLHGSILPSSRAYEQMKPEGTKKKRKEIKARAPIKHLPDHMG